MANYMIYDKCHTTYMKYIVFKTFKFNSLFKNPIVGNTR